jgi:hypothetical protein
MGFAHWCRPPVHRNPTRQRGKHGRDQFLLPEDNEDTANEQTRPIELSCSGRHDLLNSR